LANLFAIQLLQYYPAPGLPPISVARFAYTRKILLEHCNAVSKSVLRLKGTAWAVPLFFYPAKHKMLQLYSVVGGCESQMQGIIAQYAAASFYVIALGVPALIGNA
jgi:hypothetical protein